MLKSDQDVGLNIAEAAVKAEMIAIIDRTIGSFFECGEALKRVQQERLYRDEFDTFEEFLEGRWGISARRARQLIRHSDIVSALPSGTAVPLSERRTRELMPLRDKPELMSEAIATAALDDKGITSDTLRDAVKWIVRRESWIDRQAHDCDHNLGFPVPRRLIAWVFCEDLGARTLWLTGKLLPRPSSWLSDPGDDSDPDEVWKHDIEARVAAFKTWMNAVGIGDKNPLDDEIAWNDDELAKWIEFDNFTIKERRQAATGHWYCWQSLEADMPLHDAHFAAADETASTRRRQLNAI